MDQNEQTVDPQAEPAEKKTWAPPTISELEHPSTEAGGVSRPDGGVFSGNIP
jgi:hypothetical protein